MMQLLQTMDPNKHGLYNRCSKSYSEKETQANTRQLATWLGLLLQSFSTLSPSHHYTTVTPAFLLLLEHVIHLCSSGPLLSVLFSRYPCNSPTRLCFTHILREDVSANNTAQADLSRSFLPKTGGTPPHFLSLHRPHH
jgi:hypothetical protein